MENKKLSVGYALGARPKQGSNSLFQSCASFDTETHDHKKKAMDVSGRLSEFQLFFRFDLDRFVT